jgi:hypothetical protein
MLEVVVIPFDGAVQVRAGLNCWPPGRCPGRGAAHSTCGAVRRRAGAVTNSGVWYGPGSAKRLEECRIASGTHYVSTSPVLDPLAAESLAPWGKPKYDSELISISRDEVRLNSLAS